MTKTPWRKVFRVQCGEDAKRFQAPFNLDRLRTNAIRVPIGGGIERQSRLKDPAKNLNEINRAREKLIFRY